MSTTMPDAAWRCPHNLALADGCPLCAPPGTRLPAALRPDLDRIDAGRWILTVTAVYFGDAADHVEVDVQPARGGDAIWDVRLLAHQAKAEQACWLRGLGWPDVRYRLYYDPATAVPLTPEGSES